MVVQRHYWDLMRISVVLTKKKKNLSLGHMSQLRWLTCHVDCVFQQDRHMSFSEWMVLLCWPHFWALYRCIPSLAPHISHNFLSANLFKSLV